MPPPAPAEMVGGRHGSLPPSPRGRAGVTAGPDRWGPLRRHAGDTGYAAALTMILLALLATVSLVQYGWLDRRVHYR